MAKISVIGAGNVAIDAARTALRLGAANVTVVYRRTEDGMTALKSEFEIAKHEGVEFKWLRSPVQCIGTNKLTGLECEVQELTEDGKCIGTGKKEVLAADKVILAIGQRPASRIVSQRLVLM